MKVKVASRLGEVKEYYFSRKLKEIAGMRAAGLDVINLGIGSPDLPPSSETIATLIRESQISTNHCYQSYVGIPEVRQAFADWYQRHFQVVLDPAKEVLPLIGSKEGIMHISMTYLEQGDQVLVPNPGYPAYRATAHLTGATIVEYPLGERSNWLPDLQQLADTDLEKVKIMWINYPHMPTGAQANYSFFEKLVAFAHQHQILLCNDNPYSFILNDKPLSLLSVEGAKEVALELNSLSKSHNMSGWRVGVLAGREDYLQQILRFKSNMDSGMFRPVQMAAARALANPDQWYDQLNEIYRERRTKVFRILDRLGCTYQPGQAGMFVWAGIPEHYEDGYSLSDDCLQEAKVFITPGGIFGSQGDKYIRISLCSPVGVLEDAYQRLSEVFSNTGSMKVTPKDRIISK